MEPQVYDLMLPPPAAPAAGGESRRWSGSPSTRRRCRSTPARSWPASARRWSIACWRTRCERGRRAELYLVGLNLAPQDLAGQIGRALTLAAGLELRVGRVRPLHFPQAVFWFEATFVSDQKEQEILPVAIDLH